MLYMAFPTICGSVKLFLKSAFGGFGNTAIFVKWSRKTFLVCPNLFAKKYLGYNCKPRGF